MIADQQSYRIRLAIAGHAYATQTVRIADPDLRGFAHIAASRQGLFAVGPAGCRLIAHGQFYGITVGLGTIWAFEACDRPRFRSNRGRLVQIKHQAGLVTNAKVVAEELDNGCHQIDFVDGRLLVADTYNQRVLRFALDGGEPEVIYPLSNLESESGAPYVHANSILAIGSQRYLLLHNDSHRTGRDSEIAIFDEGWCRLGTIPLKGQGCHSLALLEDGTILTCGSGRGELIGTDGRAIKVCDRMTRGLSVDDAMIVVGASAILERDVRDEAPGEVIFLDRSYNRIGSVELPGPVMEVRRLDGRDRSLSAHLATLT
jgi:hypothetical protein